MSLKPCPFCGSTEVKICESGDIFYENEFFVVCLDCCRGPRMDNKEDAAAAWNERNEG